MKSKNYMQTRRTIIKDFNLLDQLDVEPAIEIRKTASTSSGGCQLRREEVVLLIKKIGYEGWKRVKDADSRRWIAEIVFSSIKGPTGRESTFNEILHVEVEAG